MAPSVAPLILQPKRLHASKIQQPRKQICPRASSSEPPFSSRVSLVTSILSKLSSLASDSQSNAQAQAGKVATRLSRVAGLRNFELDNLPPGPQGDQGVTLLNNPLEFLDRMYRDYGAAVTLCLGGELVVLIASPQLAYDIFVTQNSSFQKEGTAFFPNSSLAGNGLLVSDGQLWKCQRRLSQAAFRSSALVQYADTMQRITSNVLVRGKWSDGGVRDAYADANELTFQIAVSCLFGQQSQISHSQDDNANLTNSVKTAFSFFQRKIGSLLIIPEWLPTWDNAVYSSSVRKLDKAIYSYIKQRGQLLSQSEAGPSCLLDYLLLSKDERGVGMSPVAMRDECMTMMIAGQETSAILLAWTTALLAWNKQAQDSLRNECQRVLQGGALRLSDVGQVPFLLCVIMESLRLYPPAFMVGRCCKNTVTLGEWKVEKGTTVLIAPWLMHRSSITWTDAERFKPDRWLSYVQQHLAQNNDGTAITQPCPDSQQSQQGSEYYLQSLVRLFLSGNREEQDYWPFGGGPRSCIGTGFAVLESMIILSSIVQNYTLDKPSKDAPFPQPNPLLTLQPKEVMLKINKISSTSTPTQ